MNKASPQADYRESATIADMVQLVSYDEITEVLRSRKFVQGAYAISGKHMMRDTLTLLDGPPHMQRRRVLAHLFDDAAMAGVRERHLIPAVEQCMAEIAAQPRAADGSIPADLVLLVQRCLHRVAAALAGIDGLDNPADADRFVEQVRAIATGATVDWSRGDPQIVQRAAMQALDAFRREFFEPSVAHRKAVIDNARARGEDLKPLSNDLISMILVNEGGAWQGDPELPLREVSTFLVGASQTTAASLVLLILRLEDWFKAHPEDRKLIEADPEFLRRAAFDSLRMTVASPARIRRATEDVTLSSGRSFKAGERVALLFIPANMNPALFGHDAAEFNPHRQVKDAPLWGLAFGGGAHSCPGRPLVTGSRNMSGTIGVDGTMVSVSRRFYAAGLSLDPRRPPVCDTTTHYDLYAEVPIRFTRL
ncbi:MAG: cytochrome P450 [Betaproteobacteria bacterium]|nr:cytochrome P450 [Betaproteobacteria bacterium]